MKCEDQSSKFAFCLIGKTVNNIPLIVNHSEETFIKYKQKQKFNWTQNKSASSEEEEDQSIFATQIKKNKKKEMRST